MNLPFVARVVRERRSLRARERWSRERLHRHRAAALAELRRHAYERSPFCRRFHAGYESRALSDLPVLTKAQLMDAFDALAEAGVVPPSIDVELVEAVPKTPLGKAPLIKALRQGGTTHRQPHKPVESC